MISRLAYGAWSSLFVATGAVLFGLIFGGILGCSPATSAARSTP